MEDLYVTFILKRKPVRAYDKDQTRQICMQHLEQQTQVIKPVFILCSSSVAVHSFFKNPKGEVKSLRENGMIFKATPQLSSITHLLFSDVLTYKPCF